MNKKLILLLLAVVTATCAVAAEKRFFNLSARQVRVDSVMPEFVWSMPLTGRQQDSVYTVSLSYPEFIDASPADVAAYKRLSGEPLPAMPVVAQARVSDRGSQSLVVSFCPMVLRQGKYQFVASFMLDVEAAPIRRSQRRARDRARAEAADIYASHSVLASGNWAKIRVPRSGVYQLTNELIRRAGFSDLSRVRVYGYGGQLQNETLRSSDLKATDDLHEVPTFESGGRRLFYARGPVGWSSASATRRTRNPYSDYGYYFITQADGEPATWADSATFVNSFYPSYDDYHSLYEVDGYSWYHGGRNLFDSEAISLGGEKRVVMAPDNNDNTTANLQVVVTAGTASTAEILSNGKRLGTLGISLGNYDNANQATGTYRVSQLTGADTITVRCTSGGPIRLDYIAAVWPNPAPAPRLASVAATPEYVYNITNQDHHADGPTDMVIIIPTSQKLLAQAQRLKEFHEAHDSLSVRIVPADELYNEFASGTPDANAYRRYLKMLYDRAQSDDERPKYLLLFGDGVWDNRMLTSNTRALSPDDYLLCFESENSFNKVNCYVDDSWYGLLDEGEGSQPTIETIDVAVGRFPVTTDAEAKVMVDKVISYVNNENAGNWQNTLVFMGDDGNYDLHMRDENEVANYISALHPGFLARKVMWDAYTRVSTATGNTYPEVTNLVKRYQSEGALIMDYAGHGRADQMSHERVLTLNDFENFANTRLPLWITASCDIMAFDDTEPNIGEAAVLNSKGGAVAFYGTTRTVYADRNKYMNRAFLNYALSLGDDGKPMPLGEAHRRAQNDLMTGKGYNNESDRTSNHLQYTLLGDPAMALNLPTRRVVVDSINGTSVNSADSIRLRAGSIARVTGHITGGYDFNGTVTATVRDCEETIVCRANDPNESDADAPFNYSDRTKTLFCGSDSVRDSHFAFAFAVPMDIMYSNQTGLMNFYAVGKTGQGTDIANGASDDFIVGGSSAEATDSIGPSIYCYLNSRSFVNGGNVNTTPFFVAEVADADGINASGTGIGHDLELIVDNDPAKTYVLNSNFSFDFGSYTRGTTYYSLPALEPGRHTLLFRAWDVKNNPGTAQLAFNVVKGLGPSLFSVGVTRNPASTSTTFIISHDRTGSEVDVEIDIYDTAGRQLWKHRETGVSASGTYTVDWDLTVDGGRRLQTGVYLYKVGISTDGSKMTTKARKLVIIGNN